MQTRCNRHRLDWQPEVTDTVMEDTQVRIDD